MIKKKAGPPPTIQKQIPERKENRKTEVLVLISEKRDILEEVAFKNPATIF